MKEYDNKQVIFLIVWGGNVHFPFDLYFSLCVLLLTTQTGGSGGCRSALCCCDSRCSTASDVAQALASGLILS